MKLQLKFALYNSISKALIILAIGLILPDIIEKVVYSHIDQRLTARSQKVMNMISVGGLNTIIIDEDCSFDSYTIFKEEYISIEPLSYLPENIGKPSFVDTTRIIEDEYVRHRVISQTFLYFGQIYRLEIGEGISSIDTLKNTIWRFTLWLMIIVIIISVFLDFGFTGILMRPFNKIINEKLKSVKHPTVFNYKKIRSNTFEFTYLDQSINEMMRKIRDAFIIEKEFIQNVSHELMTPISILQNRIENMLNETNMPDEVSMKLVESQQMLNRMSKIIRALLLISKIENDQYVKNEDTGIRLVVEEVLSEIEDRFTEKNIKIIKDLPEEFIFPASNKSLIYILIFNLINNAIKYNKPQGKIFIKCHSTDSEYQLIIEDTGVGIKKENVEFIFDRFKRFHPEDEKSFGLGLPIVKTIAGYHNIKINVESEIGTGTKFTLSFPKK